MVLKERREGDKNETISARGSWADELISRRYAQRDPVVISTNGKCAVT